MAMRGSDEGRRKGGEASLHSKSVSAAELQVYLKGMHYPASKQQLIDMAKSNNAPENAMSFLNRLPDRQYGRPTEVGQEFSKLK